MWPASPAFADDSSVYQAWSGHDAELCRLFDRMDTRTRAWSRSHSRKNARRLRTTIASIRRTLKQVILDVGAESPSSDSGARGKTYAQRSNRQADSSMSELAKAVRAALRHDPDGAAAHGKAAKRRIRRAFRSQDVALEAFEKAGVPTSEDCPL
ncbi:MAG TPA: hypothetical protein VF545_00955 [Thermoleophilaceae bacterium]|jgi:hypothetical protein